MRAEGECFIDKPKNTGIINLKDGEVMSNDKLAEQSMDFAIQIINLVKELKGKSMDELDKWLDKEL